MSCPISAHFSAPHGRHPVQLLQDRAAELSGVTFDEACGVDEVNVALKIGEYGMMQVSERFLARARGDQDEWFAGMFSGREDFVQDQSDYLLQRFGGPSYYADRKGPGQLIDRHAGFECSPRTAERWLQHMDAALADTEEVSGNQRKHMMTFLRFQSYFLVAAQEAARDMATAVPRTNDSPPTPCPSYARVEAALQPVEDKPRARRQQQADVDGEDGEDDEDEWEGEEEEDVIDEEVDSLPRQS